MKTHLKALIVVFVLALGGFCFYSYMTKGQYGESLPASHLDIVQAMKASAVPNIIAENLKGKKISLSSFKGKIVIVNFWASWCGPCVEEIPSLISLAEKFKDQLVILAVSGDDQKEEIEIFKKSFPGLEAANIEIIWDKDKSIMKLFDVGRLPESYIIDRNQKLDKKIVGSINWNTSDSIDYFKALLSL